MEGGGWEERNGGWGNVRDDLHWLRYVKNSV